MSGVHPSAIVAPEARIGEDVTIGPFCLVGPDVTLGDGVTLRSHVVVEGKTEIGARTVVYAFAALGARPQDLKFAGEDSTLVIGEDNTIREGVTMNPGTADGGLVTRVGSHGLFMVGAHIAHDCVVGDHVILANNASVAGHCTVGDHAILGGLSGVHQFVRIGAHAFIGGLAGVVDDVIPFGMAVGNRANLSGLNVVGLKRRGFTREQVQELRKAYRLLFSPEGGFSERVADVESMFSDNEAVQQIVAFIKARSDRPICQPPNGAARGNDA
jgi:UDP-N-acetylglucosamine acyltransferase